MSQSHHTKIGCHTMQSEKSLTVHRCSFLGHSSEGFTVFPPRNAADISIVHQGRRIALGFSQRQGPKLLTLHWHLFLGWGNECAICLLSSNNDQKIYFGRRWQCSPLIVERIRLKHVDNPLTLMFMIGQWASNLPSWLYHLPTHLLWKDKTMEPIDCGMCRTKNQWRNVDVLMTHIETAFVPSFIGCNESQIHSWHSNLRL